MSMLTRLGKRISSTFNVIRGHEHNAVNQTIEVAVERLSLKIDRAIQKQKSGKAFTQHFYLELTGLNLGIMRTGIYNLDASARSKIVELTKPLDEKCKRNGLKVILNIEDSYDDDDVLNPASLRGNITGVRAAVPA